ncbi:MAG: DUF503 family protein [Anaerolineae bacterium]
MVIGTCTIELHIPGNGSLKGKHRVIKSIIARVHNEFNVSIEAFQEEKQPMPEPTTRARLLAGVW